MRIENCQREQGVKELYGFILPDCYALVMMCHDRWVSRPQRTGTRREATFQDYGVGVIGYQSEDTRSRTSTVFREVPLKGYSAVAGEMTRDGWRIGDRLLPTEHERRAHSRTLRSGKIVAIRAATVNKGKGRPEHRIE